jgi:nucleotide-binding universal stress UspA family protein
MISKEYNRVMVAIDGSKTAEIAFKKAVNIVKRNQGTLIITHIIDTRSVMLFPQYEPSVSQTNFLEQSSRAATRTVEAYKDWAEGKGVENIETIIRNGSPRTEIADALPEEQDLDLIILGATGLSALERAFVGSVSQYVVQNAPCDVLIVRRDSDEIDSAPIIDEDF